MNYKIGDIIEQIKIKNGNPNHSNVSGINILKQFMPSKNVGADTSKYLVVPHNCFACNLMHVGRDERIPVAMNANDDEIVVSSAYFVFQITKTEKVLPEYLNMIFQSSEFDRYAWFCTDTSIRGNLDWKRFCDIDIDLPPIEIQAKYVAVYKAMVANQQSYENGLEDLKVVCDVTLDKFKKNSPYVPVGQLFNEIDERNKGAEIQNVQGININKVFMPSVASSSDLSKYKIVRKGRFAYSSMQTGRDEVIRIALYNRDEPAVISPAYQTLVAAEGVLPEYLMMWFSRSESDRYGWFVSDGSIRASLELSRFFEIEIPLPTLELQNSIIEIYNAYTTRRELNEQLKTQIKDICPILINGAIREGKAYAEV